ncbi:MAG: hypothetical protein ACYS0I_13635 [Planctomycetota bacterium]|jgi:hypothetical protein
MLTSGKHRWIYQHAYLPEHIPSYVEAVSGAKAHLLDNYLCYSHRSHLIFIGFPLGKRPSDLPQAYDSACEFFKPATVAIIAPEIWLPSGTFETYPTDSYYRLKLPLKSYDSAVAYMIRRAAKELRVAYNEFGKEHRRLVKVFLSKHKLTSEQIHVFKHIHHYLKNCESTRLIEARKGAQLVAFTIADMGSADYAFYMFNFRSTKNMIPGASDLLFNEMVNLARSEEKKAINLGLGIHPGIRRFKEKWGGIPFLSYTSALVHRKPMELGKLANKL